MNTGYLISIGPGASPEVLEDGHKLATLMGETGHALRIRALAGKELERVRPMGTGGVKMLQQVADEIERQFLAGTYRVVGGGLAKFTVGSLTVRCRNLPGAVAIVCAKYRRGRTYKGAGKWPL